MLGFHRLLRMISPIYVIWKYRQIPPCYFGWRSKEQGFKEKSYLKYPFLPMCSRKWFVGLNDWLTEWKRCFGTPTNTPLLFWMKEQRTRIKDKKFWNTHFYLCPPENNWRLIEQIKMFGIPTNTPLLKQRTLRIW